jgi:predicted Zn-dependent peptidase
LENVDKVTFDDVKNSYKNILENSRKMLSVVGDVDDNNIEFMLNKYLSNIPQSLNADSLIPAPNQLTRTYVDYVQEDAQQAQILQGWQVASINSEDYPKLMLLNIILGASGLSSRLFLELREKKGLAYTVRTSYEVHLKSSVFSIYIGTEPSNIQTSIDGFNEEINKIKNILVSEEELHNAKNNLIGKQQFITETNSQQANLMAYYSIMGFPYNYQEELIEKIKKVTPEDLRACANKYFNDNYVIALIKP